MSMLDSKTNTNSLQFLSYLSSTANQKLKQQQQDQDYKLQAQNFMSTGSVPQPTQSDYSSSGYKTALRNFMDR